MKDIDILQFLDKPEEIYELGGNSIAQVPLWVVNEAAAEIRRLRLDLQWQTDFAAKALEREKTAWEQGEKVAFALMEETQRANRLEKESKG